MIKLKKTAKLVKKNGLRNQFFMSRIEKKKLPLQNQY